MIIQIVLIWYKLFCTTILQTVLIWYKQHKVKKCAQLQKKTNVHDTFAYLCSIFVMPRKGNMVQPVPVDSMDPVDTVDTVDTVDSVASVDSVDLSACWQNCMDVLQPQTIAPVQVGSQIVTRNPDVEVMAVLLKDLPLTPAAFKDLAKDADWYRFSFMIVKPGPAGFSTVPYNSTKKKDDKSGVNGQRLYDDMPGNKTCFHSYEKAKSNKDRGDIVRYLINESTESTEMHKQQEISGTLEPGQCIAHFLRSDDYSSKFFVDSLEERQEMNILPAYSVVYLQMSSSNVEQAKNGRLVKVKKIKIGPQGHTALGPLLSLLPSNEAAFDAINECNEAKNWSMRANMDKSSMRLHTIKVSKTAFVTADEVPVIVDANDTVSEACIVPQAMKEFLPHATQTDRLKLLNLAVACSALTVLVRTNMSSGVVLDCTKDPFTHKVVCLYVDMNALLGLVDLQQSLSMGLENEKMHKHKSFTYNNSEDHNCFTSVHFDSIENGSITWGSLQNELMCNGVKHRICFQLSLPMSDGNLSSLHIDPQFVDKNGASSSYHLKLMLLPKTVSLELDVSNHVNDVVATAQDMSNVVSANAKDVMFLEVRPSLRTAGLKRKRMQLF